MPPRGPYLLSPNELEGDAREMAQHQCGHFFTFVFFRVFSKTIGKSVPSTSITTNTDSTQLPNLQCGLTIPKSFPKTPG
ncbi:hypothetical protein IFM5058_02684 [Aspergillus udagawae]|nr:hypothetical protein IFM5058_02684 [Aspergillus udagawae]